MQQSLPDVWRDLLLLHLVKAEWVLWSRSWKKNPQPNVIIFLYEIRNVLWNVLLYLGCMFEFELEQILLTLHFLIIIKYPLTVQMQWHFSSSKISFVSFTGHETERLASMTHHFHPCLWKEHRKRLLLVVQTVEKGFDQFLAFLVVSKLLKLIKKLFFFYKSVSINHDAFVSSVY